MASKDKIELLNNLLSGIDQVTILPHINPDPDAIASGYAIKTLLESWGKSAEFLYEGRIGRAENKSLMAYLDRPMSPLLSLPTDAPILIIDTQPGAGNSPISAEINAWGTIDHHPQRVQSQLISFHDVRSDYGATATIMTQYLRAANLIPTTKLATALYYGIKTDTLDLERRAVKADVDAYEYLRPLIDKKKLSEIEQAQVSADYFRHAHTALEEANLYDNLLVCFLGDMGYPDLAAEMADWLMRYDKVEWVICIGQYQDTLHLSTRAHPHPIDTTANAFMEAIVDGLGTGGGHDRMAGGQVQLNGEKPNKLVRRLRKNALRHLKIPEKTTSQRLLNA